MVRRSTLNSCVLALLFCGSLLGACGQTVSTIATPKTSSRLVDPPMTLTGSPWAPDFSAIGMNNAHTSATVSKTVTTVTGVTMVDSGETSVSGKEVDVAIPMTTDLGEQGSLSIVAEVINKPTIAGTTAYTVLPMLVSMVEPTHSYDYVNLAHSGACSSSGYLDCDATSGCSVKSSCTMSWPSGFSSKSQWLQHQGYLSPNVSMNTFPTCNWSGGTINGGTDDSKCAFNTTFLVGGKLPYGGGYVYHARFLLMGADAGFSISGNTADLRVTVVKKTDTDTVGAATGTLDLNLILVGDKNVQASRSLKGQQNLTELLKSVRDIYSPTGISIGQVNVYEWSSAENGNYYANTPYDELEDMYEVAAQTIPDLATSEAVNLFLVSTIPYDDSSGLTILGIAGAIDGPPIGGTGASGLSFSSFNKLATYNTDASCDGTNPCGRDVQQSDFIDMGQTIAHEMGHFLGLNHPSESSGASHDVLRDTPKCTKINSGDDYITLDSCAVDTNIYKPDAGTPSVDTCPEVCSGYHEWNYVVCPDKLACQFNHTMWWTTKKIITGDANSATNGDGNLFSPDSQTIMHFHPLVQ